MSGYMAAGLAITIVACGARPSRNESTAHLAPARAPEWEAVFTRDSGWTGGDGAASVPIPGDRVLWLFGDSFIGPVVDGRHAEGTTMVNNTLAVSAGHEPPRRISFLWGGVERQPAAWAVPTQKDEWFWPAGGGLVTPGPDRLILFMSRIARRDAGDSIWNFRARGTTALVVRNPEAEPEWWKVAQHPLTTLADGGRQLMWGSGAAAIPGGEVLILGIDETNVFDKRLVMARSPATSIERFETWRFKAVAGWSERDNDAAPIANGLSSEVSLHRMNIRGRDCFVLVHSEAMLGRGIMARTCEYPFGAWSAAVRLYECPEPAGDAKLLVYSAKAHPELSDPGELLLSYCVNSTDFRDVLAHAEKYRPKFVRVPRSMLPDPG